MKRGMDEIRQEHKTRGGAKGLTLGYFYIVFTLKSFFLQHIALVVECLHL